MALVDQIRSRCEQLHNLETMEPEDVYQQVADEFGIDIEDLNDILASDE
jgi:predicted nuclease of restriction endonuclease-like RecB superfamily